MIPFFIFYGLIQGVCIALGFRWQFHPTMGQYADPLVFLSMFWPIALIICFMVWASPDRPYHDGV